MNITATDFDCPVMISAGRLGRAKDAFDNRAVFRRHFAAKVFAADAGEDIAAARGALRAMVDAVHGAPSHLAPKLYPLVMAAEVRFRHMLDVRASRFAQIDTARAA